MNSYLTISDTGEESLYTEKRSRFIGRAFPVETAEEALAVVAEARKKYRDARHACWAYRLGTDDEAEERANDDGEPAGSAGKPILGQIISRDLRNVAVVVVRYYGGVNLGTGGLAVAYKTAAGEALDLCKTKEITLYERYLLEFPFDYINPVMMLLRKAEAVTAEDSDADEKGFIWEIEIPKANAPTFEAEAERLYRLTVKKCD